MKSKYYVDAGRLYARRETPVLVRVDVAKETPKTITLSVEGKPRTYRKVEGKGYPGIPSLRDTPEEAIEAFREAVYLEKEACIRAPEQAQKELDRVSRWTGFSAFDAPKALSGTWDLPSHVR